MGSTRVGPSLAGRAVAAVAGPLVARIVRLPARALAPTGRARPAVDGQSLSPALALVCRLSTPIVDRALARPSAPLRAVIDLFAGSMTHGAPTNVPARDVDLTPTGLRGRLYRPRELGAAAPLLVFFHGGGFVFGSAAGHEGTCAFLARRAGVNVLSVDYPLAPEHPAPAAHAAAAAAWEWALANAGALGADPRRIGVGGDSAGGNLAAAVALGDLGGLPRPCYAFLLYPVTDLQADDPSVHEFAEGLLLTRRGLSHIAGHYAPGGDGGDRRHAVTSNPVPPDAPPVFIGVAGMDPLRDQGVRLADHLRAAGAQVELQRYDGVVHGFATLLVVDECRAATTAAADVLARRL